MTPTLPFTIRRSYAGLFGILAIGIFTVGLIIVGSFVLAANHVAPPIYQFLYLIAIIVFLVTLVVMAVYWSGNIVLTEQGVTVTNFLTLWASTSAVTEWNDVEDVTVTTPSGVLNTVTNTGTLAIQTAGTLPNFSLSWVGTPYKWQRFLDQKANAASPNAV